MNIRIVEEVTSNDHTIRREVEVNEMAGSLTPQETSAFIAEVVGNIMGAIRGKDDK